ncbi:MAG: hypothetical protein J4F46_11015 [Dehalococcoidia bacterium]|nr:hypothetical protein [Dehalococcoidia bacterium]
MAPLMEQEYLQLARDNPNILCSDVPIEALEAAIDDLLEPSDFFREFLEAGHTQWLLQKHGRLPRSREQINTAIVMLWIRACRLHTSYVLNRPDPDWGKPFFSDEGLEI